MRRVRPSGQARLRCTGHRDGLVGGPVIGDQRRVWGNSTEHKIMKFLFAEASCTHQTAIIHGKKLDQLVMAKDRQPTST